MRHTKICRTALWWHGKFFFVLITPLTEFWYVPQSPNLHYEFYNHRYMSLPAVITLDEVAIAHQGTLAPAGWTLLVLRRAIAVCRIVRISGVVPGSGTSKGTIEFQTGNDGLGEWRGRWSRRGWRSIVMILITHEGRLMHLQTTGLRYQNWEGGRTWNRKSGKSKRMKVRMKNKTWQICKSSVEVTVANWQILNVICIF